ncbi:MAG TPA: GNAT family N-acetyltransferase [Streptosporangiaceae bacterium]|nr:GNAT family N-acetyltransferase [Streptosporangiaceae bacterium]
MSASIRRYRASDRDDVYDVCVRTGAAGQDARGRYSTDSLLGDIYAGPYLHIAPEHAHVLDNGERSVGYVIGTPSTREFVAAYLADWLPRMRGTYAPPAGTPASDEERKLADMFGPEHMLRPELEPHPAHLHINLLPDYQGAGHGREMMATFLDSVAAVGARSCHLTVRAANTGALRFYDKLGWRRIEVADPGPSIFLVKSTTG